MISRVAEACFWLGRYIERAENTARLLRVNRAFVLDVSLGALQRWRPIVVVSGEEERFCELYGEDHLDEGDSVQRYLSYEPQNAVSILSSFRYARENARTIREVISREMWECLNEGWHWLKNEGGRTLFERDPDAFYGEVKSASALFSGVMARSMLHDEAFDFINLGALLERAGQTARIVDVKYHLLGPGEDTIETPLEAAHWSALLGSCSASEPYFRSQKRTPRGRSVVAFLLKEALFPRSVTFGLDGALTCLRRIRQVSGPIGETAEAKLAECAGALRNRSVEEIFAESLHHALTELVDQIAEIGGAIDRDYFNPSFAPAISAAPS